MTELNEPMDDANRVLARCRVGLKLKLSEAWNMCRAMTTRARDSTRGRVTVHVGCAMLRDVLSTSPLYSGRTVLIVEDDEDMVAMLEFVLRRYGQETITAHDARTALQLVRLRQPD